MHDDTVWSKFFPISVNRGHQRRTRWARSCSSSTRRSLPQNILSPRKKVGTPKAPRSNARRALSHPFVDGAAADGLAEQPHIELDARRDRRAGLLIYILVADEHRL